MSSNTKIKIQDKQWKSVGNDLIVMFLDKIFEQCNHSLFTMERYLKDVIWNNTTTNDEYKKLYHDLEKEYDELEGSLSSTSWELEKLKHEYTIIKKTLNKKDKYINELKKNSILFTMNDIVE